MDLWQAVGALVEEEAQRENLAEVPSEAIHFTATAPDGQVEHLVIRRDTIPQFREVLISIDATAAERRMALRRAGLWGKK